MSCESPAPAIADMIGDIGESVQNLRFAERVGIAYGRCTTNAATGSPTAGTDHSVEAG